MWPWVLPWLGASSCNLSRITGLSVLQISGHPNVNPQFRAGFPQTIPFAFSQPQSQRAKRHSGTEEGLHVAPSDPEPTEQSP